MTTYLPDGDGERRVVAEVWNITASLDGYRVFFHGDPVADAPTFDEARAKYNTLRSAAALARESLRHVLSQERAG